MSSIVNKVKDALPGHKNSQPEGTHGPHTSRAGNAADPRVDSDRDHRAGHTTGTTTGNIDPTYSTGDNYTLGSGAAGTTGTAGTAGPASKTDGPHKSNMMNKADPRVDSDRDYSRNVGANPHGTATTGSHDAFPRNTTTTTAGTGMTGTHGTTTGHVGTTGGVSEGTFGPHNSRAANAADPRVDSDLDRSRNVGITGTTGARGLTGAESGQHIGPGPTTTHGTTGAGVAEGTFGPHSSRVANAADPRVDSDLDRSRNVGTTGTTGTTGTMGTMGTTTTGRHVGTTGGVSEGTFGPHSSRAANAADPRVDSDLDRSRNVGTTGTTTGHTSGHTTGHTTGMTGTHGTTTGTTGGVLGGTHTTGPAPNTAGPHKSDMMNKADPRVDSDLDGSKTYGGDKTHASTHTSTHRKDPTDAAQVPPSVLQKHIGEPSLAHDDHTHDRERRHSVNHQELHRGL